MNPRETKGVTIISDHEFIYQNAHCFQIHIPGKLGAAQEIYYDVAALRECCRIIKEQNIRHPIVYEVNLETNLKGLIERMKDGNYWPKPSDALISLKRAKAKCGRWEYPVTKTNW